MVKPTIFLSYAREDGEQVAELYQQLTDAGFAPWMDTKDILPGQNWKYHTNKALKQSDLVIVCLSVVSVVKRSEIQKEIRIALDRLNEKLDSDIYIIPVRLDDCDVPESLSHIQWIDINADDGWDKLLTAIRSSLNQYATNGMLQRPGAKREVLAKPRANISTLSITSPHDREVVDRRPVVSGRVSTPNVSVWVIVHPMESSSYWVQPPTSMHADGVWGVQIYVGSQKTLDEGKQFEIMAVANPKLDLQEGMILDRWPVAEQISPVIQVERRKSGASPGGGHTVVVDSRNGPVGVIIGDDNKITQSKERSTRAEPR
jgi:hypothetical protein